MRHFFMWTIPVATGAVLGAACGSSQDDAAGAAGNANGAATGGSSPSVTIPAAGSSGSYRTCTGRIAETHFMNALCTCKNVNVAGYLRARGFDSSQALTAEHGGSVGINHTYLNSAGFTDVGGSLAIAGHDSLSLAGYLKTGGDLRVQGRAAVAGYTNVGRSMWLGDGYTDVGPITVAGDLHGSGVVTAAHVSVGGKRIAESVTVAPPCPCNASDLLDVGALVADAWAHNDNAAGGIQATQLNTVLGHAEVTLPGGRIYVEHISGIGNVIVNVSAKTALFVDGSINNIGNLEFRLDPGAEIDVFIRDNLAVTGRAVFGQKDRPAASRIYVGGDGNVMLIGDGEFVGNLYAPQSLVQAVGYIHVYGSLFARDFVIPGYADFSYDLAIQRAGGGCGGQPSGACAKCGSCAGGKACVGGSCGACRNDGDCCSQAVCVQGTCTEPGDPIK
jgi:hypothetical protein